MAVPRSSSLRGTRVPGASASRAGQGSLPGARRTYDGVDRVLPRRDPEAAPVGDPLNPRSVVDYGLARRATLETLFTGGGFRSDVCDADPYLLRAAKHHGEPTDRRCPVCRQDHLTHVTYTFGDQLGPYSGRVRASADLPAMAKAHGEFRVYVVEVCRGCTWNHLVTSYVLGDGVSRPVPRRPRDLLD